MRIGYVYVGKGTGDARNNWRLGIEHGVWGWETSVLTRKDGFPVARSLKAGDLVVLARGGPTPRVKPGMWSTASLAEAWFAYVTTPLYESAEQVWRDKPYPNRIGLQQIDVRTNVSADELGVEGMENLRLSGSKQGAPVVGQQDLALDDQEDPEDPAPPPNALAMTVVRLEQRKLRKSKFGDWSHVSCELCGRLFPRRLVRAAHIKRRSWLEPGEYLQLANIMAACTFGCDELFEHGYVYVDQSGRIRPGTQMQPGSSIENVFKDQLAERICAAYSMDSARFFEFHRNVVANVGRAEA